MGINGKGKVENKKRMARLSEERKKNSSTEIGEGGWRIDIGDRKGRSGEARERNRKKIEEEISLVRGMNGKTTFEMEEGGRGRSTKETKPGLREKKGRDREAR